MPISEKKISPPTSAKRESSSEQRESSSICVPSARCPGTLLQLSRFLGVHDVIRNGNVDRLVEKTVACKPTLDAMEDAEMMRIHIHTSTMDVRSREDVKSLVGFPSPLSFPTMPLPLSIRPLVENDCDVEDVRVYLPENLVSRLNEGLKFVQAFVCKLVPADSPDEEEEESDLPRRRRRVSKPHDDPSQVSSTAGGMEIVENTSDSQDEAFSGLCMSISQITLTDTEEEAEDALPHAPVVGSRRNRRQWSSDPLCNYRVTGAGDPNLVITFTPRAASLIQILRRTPPHCLYSFVSSECGAANVASLLNAMSAINEVLYPLHQANFHDVPLPFRCLDVSQLPQILVRALPMADAVQQCFETLPVGSLPWSPTDFEVVFYPRLHSTSIAPYFEDMLDLFMRSQRRFGLSLYLLGGNNDALIRDPDTCSVVYSTVSRIRSAQSDVSRTSIGVREGFRGRGSKLVLIAESCDLEIPQALHEMHIHLSHADTAFLSKDNNENCILRAVREYFPAVICEMNTVYADCLERLKMHFGQTPRNPIEQSEEVGREASPSNSPEVERFCDNFSTAMHSVACESISDANVDSFLTLCKHLFREIVVTCMADSPVEPFPMRSLASLVAFPSSPSPSCSLSPEQLTQLRTAFPALTWNFESLHMTLLNDCNNILQDYGHLGTLIRNDLRYFFVDVLGHLRRSLLLQRESASQSNSEMCIRTRLLFDAMERSFSQVFTERVLHEETNVVLRDLKRKIDSRRRGRRILKAVAGAAPDLPSRSRSTSLSPSSSPSSPPSTPALSPTVATGQLHRSNAVALARGGAPTSKLGKVRQLIAEIWREEVCVKFVEETFAEVRSKFRENLEAVEEGLL